MHDSDRPTRPTPRTAAALEAEIRRRLRGDLAAARAAAEESDAPLSDETLAALIARAVVAAMTWHLDQPEHARGLDRITTRTSNWRGAPGPRGAGPRPREEWVEEEGFQPPPPRGPRPPRDDRDRGFDRDFDRRGPRPGGPGPRFGPGGRGGGPRSGPGGRGGGPRFGPGGRGGPSGGGGFGPRRPRT